MTTLSGPAWVQRFPTSTRTTDLVTRFGTRVDAFVGALRAAGATVSIAATLRPPERAHLMHYSFRVAREMLSPSSVPAMAGVDIEWSHVDAQGAIDLRRSRAAAVLMVVAYGIVFRPALTSRHSEGRAIDMTIGNYVGRRVADAAGQRTELRTAAQLHALGSTYGVIKLVSDRPHWSDDGH